jgi:hypothetical protein
LLQEAAFPDVEDVLLDLLGSALGSAATVVTALPADMTQPVVKVNRTGGPTDLHTDYPTVVMQSYAPNRDTAWSNARLVQQVILAARRKSVTDGQIDRTKVIVGLSQPPYDDPNVFRVTGTYGLTLRRPRTS